MAFSGNRRISSDSGIPKRKADRVRISLGGIVQRDNPPDGSMRQLINLKVSPDGCLVPVLEGREAWRFSDSGKDIKYPTWHLVGDHCALLYTKENKIYAVICEKPYRMPSIVDTKNSIMLGHTDNHEIKGLAVIGNTVSVVCQDIIYYALLKERKYLWLGIFPELPVIQFCAQPFGDSKGVGKDTLTVTQPEGVSDEKFAPQLEGSIAKHMSQKGEDGRMYYPHFVRYAFRLFDGSVICHSSPILIYATLNKIMHKERNALTHTVTFESYKLLMHIPQQYSAQINALAKWKDVIKSIDIFLSDGISKTFGGDYSDFAWARNIKPIDYGRRGGGGYYDRNTGNNNTSTPWDRNASSRAQQSIEDAQEDGFDNIMRSSDGVFYLARSITIEELLQDDGKGNYSMVFKKGAHAEKEREIVLKEVMPQCGYSHHKLGANLVYTLNNRLRLGDTTTTLYRGHGAELMYAPQGSDGLVDDKWKSGYIIRIAVTIVISGVSYHVTREVIVTPVDGKISGIGHLLSYPDDRATSMRVMVWAGNKAEGTPLMDKTYQLAPHPSMDIAYCSVGFGITTEGKYSVGGIFSGRTR